MALSFLIGVCSQFCNDLGPLPRRQSANSPRRGDTALDQDLVRLDSSVFRTSQYQIEKSHGLDIFGRASKNMVHRLSSPLQIFLQPCP